MELKEEPVCRLCFEICSTGFEIVEDTIQETLNFVLLDLDLGISNEPVVCNNCTDNLKKCFHFKQDRLCVGGTSLPITEKDMGLNTLKLAVNGTVDVADAVGAFNRSDICYFCMNLVASDSLVYFEKEDMNTVVILEKYFPELAVNIFKNSAACMPCYKSLQRHISFMSNCLNVEEKIREYCRVEGTDSKGQVKLSNVLYFASKSELNALCKLTAAPLGDEWCKQLKTEDAEIKIKNEDCIKIEQPALDLEYGDDTIKIEQMNFDRLENHQEPNVGLVTPKNKISEKRMYKCKSCPYQSDSPSNVRRHSVTHKSDSEVTMYKCAQCTYQCKHKRYLLVHMLSHRDTSDGTICKCSSCTYETRHKHYLQKHMYIHKNPSETKHECEICTYQTFHKSRLNIHMLTHKSMSEITAYKCNTCDFKTKLKSNLRRHMVTHKNASAVTMYKCDKCQFQTKYKRSLPHHMLRHKSSLEVTMYECNLCKYKSKLKTNLSQHMRRLHQR